MSKLEYLLIFILVVIIGLVLWALFGTWIQGLIQSVMSNIMQ
jgi:hypothetical protein